MRTRARTTSAWAASDSTPAARGCRVQLAEHVRASVEISRLANGVAQIGENVEARTVVAKQGLRAL